MSFSEDYHQLADLLVDVAGKILAERGEFPPFSAAVGNDGEHFLYDAEGSDESLESDPELIELALRDGLARAAADKQLRAIGLCTHSVLKDDSGELEVVLMRLCHRNEASLNVIVPVTRKGSEIELGQPSLFTGTLQLFLVAN